MGPKEAPDSSEAGESGSFPASEPTEFEATGQRLGLKVVTLAPSTVSKPDLFDASDEVTLHADPYMGCTIDGRYKVEARLGEGGMGVVYRCTHKIIGKKVAMKVLRADLARENEATERFLNEAKAASSIGNPHIIDISDFGQFPDGSTYFVMEYLDGQALSTVIGSGPLPLERILSIAAQLAEGLHAAHTAQIVHRDLKPDNIVLVTRGRNKDFVKILDFGIAKVSTAEGKLTRAGAVFGTPHYMSPEQAAGSPVDHRGDIYSMGVILYELTSGRVPFDADNFMGILTQHIYKSPVPIRALVPQPQGVSPGLEAIILKCLSKRPEQRYESMQTLLDDLRKLERGAAPDAVEEMMKRSGSFQLPPGYFDLSKAASSASPPSGRVAPRTRRWFALGAGAALLLLAGLFFARGQTNVDPKPAAAVAGPTSESTPRAPADAAGTPEASVAERLQVVLAVEPLDAHVFREGQDLGQSPVIVSLDSGGEVTLQIRRDGYEDQTVVLDGSEPRRSIKLNRKTKETAEHAKPKPKPQLKPKPGPAPKQPKPSIGGNEIINPWAQ